MPSQDVLEVGRGDRWEIDPTTYVNEQYQPRVRARWCVIEVPPVRLMLSCLQDQLAEIVLIERTMRFGGLVTRKAPRDMDLERPDPRRTRRFDKAIEFLDRLRLCGRRGWHWAAGCAASTRPPRSVTGPEAAASTLTLPVRDQASAANARAMSSMPSRTSMLQRSWRLALGHRRIDRRRRYLHTGSGSCQRYRPNDRPGQRAIVRFSVDSDGATYPCPHRATRTGPIRAQALS